jgi:geranyl-CoA carboxylase alpha subunit
MNGVQYSLSAARLSAHEIEVSVNREKTRFIYSENGQRLSLVGPRKSYELTNIAGGQPSGAESGGGGIVRAPMHGLLMEILVSVDQAVSKGDKIAVLEAMKMQHEILAEVDGTVAKISAKAGMQIAVDDLIMEITETAAKD